MVSSIVLLSEIFWAGLQYLGQARGDHAVAAWMAAAADGKEGFYPQSHCPGHRSHILPPVQSLAQNPIARGTYVVERAKAER